MPDRYAVIGNPVAHSKSPLIHAAFARETGQDLSYTAILAATDAFEREVRRFATEGGHGLNVTLPFKHRAFAIAEERSERAMQALAVNTLAFHEQRLFGDNTDGVGLVRDLTINLRCALDHRRVLLMGAGGAAYGVCGPLLDERPARLVVANRTRDKAVALCEHFTKLHSHADVLSAQGYEDLSGLTFDIVINATSAGLADAMPPLPADIFASGALAYEMLYGRSTPFLEFASAQGARTADGLGMLVEQAAESFYVWRAVRPRTAPVIAMLRTGER
jgi:shikimate dehydrogenase